PCQAENPVLLVPLTRSGRCYTFGARSPRQVATRCRGKPPTVQPRGPWGAGAPHAGRVNHMRRSVLLIALVMLLAAASAVPPAAMGQAGGGKTLIMALDQSDVKTLDPGREFEFGAAFVDLNCYDTLVAHKSPKELNTFVPVLATS